MAYLSNIRTCCRPVSARRASLLSLMDLYRQRRALARLEDAALNDLGLSRDAAKTEARRLPWDIPANWYR